MSQLQDQIAAAERLAESQMAVTAEQLKLERARATAQEHTLEMQQAVQLARMKEEAEWRAQAWRAEQLLESKKDEVRYM